ncbi:glycosyltransferase [Sphingorhabdus buctiana]|uniref:Glycosyltransferase n=1 Tax=Sphingorhabdus buctiana TaxID=1508805 RepID=A0ABW4MAI5_9SPHN
MTADRRGIILSCATALDRLGHGEMLDGLCSCLVEHDKYKEIICHALSVLSSHSTSNSKIIGIKVGFIGKYYTVETKNYLYKKLRYLGILIFFCIRFYSLIIYYIKLYRSCHEYDTVVDLEYEPIQSMIAQFLSGHGSRLHCFAVVHSFPNPALKGFKSVYKAICLRLIKRHVAKGNMIGVMTQADLELAKAQGISTSKLALVGWGLDPEMDALPAKTFCEAKMPIRYVCPGVLRQGKKIDSVLSFFASLNDEDISLKVAGAPIDVDVADLRNVYERSNSATEISVEAKFFQKSEFDELFVDADIIVLSHDSSFHSMSGPLLQALRNRKPILCFSQNNVSKIVVEADAGLVVNFDDPVTSELVERIKVLRYHRYDLDNQFAYTWRSISRRVVDCITQNKNIAGKMK